MSTARTSDGEERRASWLDALAVGAATALVLWLVRVQPALPSEPSRLWVVALVAAAVVAGCTAVAAAVLALAGARLVAGGFLVALAVSSSVIGAVVITAGPGGRYLDGVSGTLVGVVVVVGCVRELVARRERSALVADLERQVRTDGLTGLPNRHDLLESVHREHGQPGRGSTVAVELGIDSFYEYNVQLGAARGDEALRVVAQALREAIPAGWTVHRLGGDQFVLRGPGDSAAGAACAQAALDAVVAAAVPGAVPLSASAGVAEARPGASDPTAVLADASAALRATKKTHDGGIAVHDAAMAASSQRQQLVTAALRSALAQDGVVAHLQPVVDITTGCTAGVELLARWHDPDLGHVPPDEFVPLAESTGLVHQLGTSVLRHGLDAFVAAGCVERRLRVAVNASVHELRRPDYTDQLRATAASRGVPLELITVEVTESLFVARDGPRLPHAAGARRRRCGAGHRRLRHRLLLPGLPREAARHLRQGRQVARRGGLVQRAFAGPARRRRVREPRHGPARHRRGHRGPGAGADGQPARHPPGPGVAVVQGAAPRGARGAPRGARPTAGGRLVTPWWVSVRVAVVVSAASLVAVAALGVTGTGRADVVGVALTGVWASLAAVAVLLAPRSADLSLRWRACGLWLALPYGVGQLVLAVEKASVSGVLAFPAAGDLISFLAAPGWFAVLLLVPRPAGPAGRLPRVLADVGVVAVAVGLLFWRIAFTDVHADTATVVASVATQLLELVILALVVQLVVVSRDRGAALLALGVAMIVTGDLAYAAAVLQDVALPPVAAGRAAVVRLAARGCGPVRGPAPAPAARGEHRGRGVRGHRRRAGAVRRCRGARGGAEGARHRRHQRGAPRAAPARLHGAGARPAEAAGPAGGRPQRRRGPRPPHGSVQPAGARRRAGGPGLDERPHRRRRRRPRRLQARQRRARPRHRRPARRGRRARSAPGQSRRRHRAPGRGRVRAGPARRGAGGARRRGPPRRPRARLRAGGAGRGRGEGLGERGRGHGRARRPARDRRRPRRRLAGLGRDAGGEAPRSRPGGAARRGGGAGCARARGGRAAGARAGHRPRARGA
ncbi:MAG: EAL domain-containing protein [Quadrisphaera sp.]